MPLKVDLSPYMAHERKWKDCAACPLHATRTRIVLARGTVPCDVLLVGEAPGHSEDTLGEPFRGRAGRELDEWIEEAVRLASAPGLHMAFTNLIACIPISGTSKTEEPDDEWVTACKPRLEEFVALVARPRLVVRVGKHSQAWLEQGIKGNVVVPPGTSFVDLLHPAYVLRQTIAAQSFTRLRQVTVLRDALLELTECS